MINRLEFSAEFIKLCSKSVGVKMTEWWLKKLILISNIEFLSCFVMGWILRLNLFSVLTWAEFCHLAKFHPDNLFCLKSKERTGIIESLMRHQHWRDQLRDRVVNTSPNVSIEDRTLHHSFNMSIASWKSLESFADFMGPQMIKASEQRVPSLSRLSGSLKTALRVASLMQ